MTSTPAGFQLISRGPEEVTDLHKSTVVCLFLVICAWVRGWEVGVSDIQRITRVID